MENTTQPRLPANVVDRAVCLIAQQETTPESPGTKTPDGQVSLCASAALAVAGLEIQGDSDRAGALREGIASSDAKDDIRRVFVEQGWSSDLCNHIMIFNNMLSPRERSRGVMEYLRILRSRPDTVSSIDAPPESTGGSARHGPAGRH